jgi:hypothetical protein
MTQETEGLNALVKRASDKHHKPYYDWIRNVITLSVAALTSLVALQQSYIPKEPKFIWMLALSWLGFLCTILTGIYALRSEFMSYLDSIDTLNRMRKEKGEARAIQEIQRTGLTAKPNRWHRLAVMIMQWSFVIALFGLSMFAVLNLPMQ